MRLIPWGYPALLLPKPDLLSLQKTSVIVLGASGLLSHFPVPLYSLVVVERLLGRLTPASPMVSNALLLQYVLAEGQLLQLGLVSILAVNLVQDKEL